jgi:hypothetical protein
MVMFILSLYWLNLKSLFHQNKIVKRLVAEHFE